MPYNEKKPKIEGFLKQSSHAWLHQSQAQFHGCPTCFSKKYYVEPSPKILEKLFLKRQPENVALSNS